MTIAEVLLGDFDIEMSNTRRTLERIPEDKPDYRPHAKSMPMGRLAMHCATMPLFGMYIMEDEGMDMSASKHPQADLTYKSRQDCLKQFDHNVVACRAALAVATDDNMTIDWRFSFGDYLISNTSRAITFRTLFFDHLIHHVAQLGVYLRMNDIPVPALYGPSADEQWIAN